jgi:hypothetical protein
MSAKPMHGGIISENVEARMPNVEGMTQDESGDLPERAFFRHLSFVISGLFFALRTIRNIFPPVRQQPD